MRTLAGLVTAALATVLASRLSAQTKPDDEESKLLAILAEETAVATKTRLNSDFVPGIVTVLHGEDLEALGVETAWEALSFVPGIQPFRDTLGQPSMIVRGVPFPFNSGNVKILVNGISLSREIAGVNGIALLIPIQQVDRIEVIRGPGSVVYGDFAFMGIVNVVTRRQTGVYGRFGGYDATTAGAQVSGATADGGLRASLAGGGYRSNDAPIGEPQTAKERRGWGAATLEGGGFSLTAEAVARRLDGTSTVNGQTAFEKQSHMVVEGRYGRDLAPSLHAEARASYRDDDFADVNTVSGAVREVGLDLTYGGLRQHSVFASLSYEVGTIDDATFHLAPPPPPAPAPPPLVIHDKRREVLGITLQDQIDLSEKLTVTAGLRFDRYTDVDHRATPRLALVYRLSERHILKVQYAEGFRAPTLFELYSTGSRNPDIGFELNRTGELDYVYRRPRSVGRATVFVSKLDDMIFIADPQTQTFGNVRRGRAWGVEVEWEQELLSVLKANANVSWVDAADDRSIPPVTDPPTPEARWLGNLSLLYRPISGVVAGVRWNHVGKRAAAVAGDGYDLVDLTVTKSDVLSRGVSLAAGVKDVFGSAPVYLLEGPFATTPLRFPGRTLFVQLAWKR